jgi:hypothetical protein
MASFLHHNTYSLADFVPWLVVFVIGGKLRDREDLFFDASREISPFLLAEWRSFHNQRGRHPVVSVHFPLEGPELFKSLERLGVASHSVGVTTALYLNSLHKISPFMHCFMPVAILLAIEEEARGSLPIPRLERTIKGAWLSKAPQSRWSQVQSSPSGKSGYLSFASVYPTVSTQWQQEVTIFGPEATPQPPWSFDSLEDWLTKLRKNEIRIVPILAASESDEASWQVGLRSLEAHEPRAVLYQNSTQQQRLPEGWWGLSADLHTFAPS